MNDFLFFVLLFAFCILLQLEFQTCWLANKIDRLIARLSNRS